MISPQIKGHKRTKDPCSHLSIFSGPVYGRVADMLMLAHRTHAFIHICAKYIPAPNMLLYEVNYRVL